MKRKDLMKRIQATTMAAIMAVSMIPAPAYAEAGGVLPDELQQTVSEETELEEEAEDGAVTIAPDQEDGEEVLIGEDLYVENQEAAEQALSEEEGQVSVQAAVDTAEAIKTAFDSAVSTIYPNTSSVTNINEYVKELIVSKTGASADAFTVEVAATGDKAVIEEDGTIHYVTMDSLAGVYIYAQNIKCTFTITCNGETSTTKEHSVMVGWDHKEFEKKMQAEADALTEEKILGENTSKDEVTQELQMPEYPTGSSMTSWTKISWTSSDTNIIQIDSSGWDGIKGKVTQPAKDTQVTLTATMKANPRLINKSMESFEPVTKQLVVTVKGTGAEETTEEKLQAILNKYYTADDLLIFGTSTKLDTENCTSDIQLPRYTNFEDENGDHVFANKELTITSDNETVMKVSGRKATIDPFQPNNITVNLVITFTRDNVTVSKKIPITVRTSVTEADIDKELEVMAYVKEHYFDGIKWENADKDHITKNLHAFRELYLDESGNYIWVYDIANQTDKGIAPDDYFTDTWEMEAAGYNKFKSSNDAVVQHDNLVVIQPKSATEITISSLLSSERYGQYADAHKPDNETDPDRKRFFEKLQKLYKQEVSVTVTVLPDTTAADQLTSAIASAKELADSITEGTQPGQYPEGTKAKLNALIEEAEALLKDESATSDQLTELLVKLQEAEEAAKEAQNANEADVTIKADTGNGTETFKLHVTAGYGAQFGYANKEGYEKEVTVQDVLAAAHVEKYGDAFVSQPQDYLVIGNGMISKLFGKESSYLGYCINNKIPGASMANDAVMKNGDELNVFYYQDTATWYDLYLYFESVPSGVKAQEAFTVTLKGYHAAWGDDAVNQAGYTVSLKDAGGNVAASAVTNADGQVTLKAEKAGQYQLTVTAVPEDSSETACIYPTVSVTIAEADKQPQQPQKPAHTHKYGAWKKTADATVFAAEKQERTCSCGKKKTRTVGKKLTPKMSVNVSSLPLKVKQSTTAVKVTGLAKGDQIASWKSGNTKIFNVDKNGKITAGKKTGKATLTITLKSGLSRNVTIKVQKKAVKTTKISGISKKLTLQKGKTYQLKPVITPLTSREKIKYTSSNKKVVKVSSKGVITAKKAGKATITVKSGKKRVKIKVTVPKTTKITAK